MRLATTITQRFVVCNVIQIQCDIGVKTAHSKHQSGVNFEVVLILKLLKLFVSMYVHVCLFIWIKHTGYNT